MKLQTTPNPTQSNERIEFVDILRGFALFGVLAMNMNAFSGHSFTIREVSDSLDKTVLVLLQFFLQAKFYSLFSLLFGWGMATQLARAATRGTRFLPLVLRRNIILLGIGLIHGFFIWDGDILTVYASLAFLLVLFRNRRPRTILIFSTACLIISIVMTLPGETMEAVRLWYTRSTSSLRQHTLPLRLYATGTYPEIFQLRKEQFISAFSNFLFWFGNIFSMFLLGFYVGKRGIFNNIQQHLPLIRKVMWIGLILGLLFNGIFVRVNLQPGWLPQTYNRLATSGARTIGAPALMLFYLCGIILLTGKESWYSRLTLLAPVGRMSLSNYLMQSILCTLIFYGYGLGLYGEISPTVGLILSIFIFMGQMRFSAWWMERYQFGPAEWLWRSLTYGKRQPFRKGETYADLRAHPLIREFLRRIRHIPQKVALAGAWIFLLVWAGSLIFWNYTLDSRGFEEPITIVVRVTATPEGGTLSESGEQETLKPGEISIPVVQPVDRSPGPIASSGDMVSLATTFDVDTALSHIETLTSSTFQGRYAGTAGGFAAGDYIADKFESYGLQPAGDNSSYFQEFPIYINQLADIPTLSIESPGGVRIKANLYQDFSPITSRYLGTGKAEGEITWADQCNPEVLGGLDLVGKIVMCQGIIFTDDILNTGRLALEYGASGLLLLTDPEVRAPDFGSRYYLPWVPETIPAFRVYPGIVDEILAGTDYTLDDLLASMPPTQLPTSASLELETLGDSSCPLDGCLARNVLGVIPGRDPTYAHEVILIGGHYDHMGASPDGTIWYGADDNASGIAALLEIARSWQEQGYVPRRTVVFAAWDAEELGLLGSIHYVENPSYPLENTVAMVQLDMVGAGAEYLSVSGEDVFEAEILSTAEMLGVEAVGSDMSSSDHAPFWMSGVPASLIIWWDENTANHVHLTSDTIEVIKPEKLEAAAEIAGLTLLNLAESEPAILDLLNQRAVAVEKSDRSAFLATSHSSQKTTDQFWFEELQTLNPVDVDMQAMDLQISGDTANARVQIQVEHTNTIDGETADEPILQTAELQVQFIRDNNGWQWTGPHLAEAPRDADIPSFRVLYPPEREFLPSLGEFASEKYTAIAGQLGFPTDTDANLFLYPTAEALRTNIALTLPQGQEAWVAPGEIHLVYNPEVGTSAQFTTTLTQLVLANAGVPQEAAAWLWEGLPLLLQTQVDQVGVQSALLPELSTALDIYPTAASASFNSEGNSTPSLLVLDAASDGEEINSAAMSWAACETLLGDHGWTGLGAIIQQFGQSCQTSGCQIEAEIEEAYHAALQMDSQSFETSWRNQWREKLETIQENLDSLVASRIEATLNKDIEAFLRTVDPSVPNLVNAEHRWISNLIENPPEELSILAQSLTIHEDDLVLASVSLDSKREGEREDHLVFPILVNMAGSNPLWMGTPFETLHGENVDVRFPSGGESIARGFQLEVDRELSEIATTLEISPTNKLTLELFTDPAGFSASIFFQYPLSERTAAWTAQGENIKLYLLPGEDPLGLLGSYRSELSTQITRWLLSQSGIDSEWLLKGVSSFLTRPFDGGETSQEIGAAYPQALEMLETGTLPKLSSLVQDHKLNLEGFTAARLAAWDSVRYLVETHSWQALLTLLQLQRQGVSLEDSVERALGIPLSSFEWNWKQSLGSGYIEPEWFEIAQTFDGEAAASHVDILTGDQMGGRQAGSPEDQVARAYIAEQFASYGLLPAGDIEGTSYFQPFNITTTFLSSPPRLEFVGDEEQNLIFREDFSPLRSTPGGDTQASGELVWVSDYDELQFGEVLTGTIIVRSAIPDIEVEITQAISHGAAGLIIVGDDTDDQIYAKQPEIYAYPSTTPIPVFNLTRNGFQKLLEISRHSLQSIYKLPPIAPLEIHGEMAFRLPPAAAVPTANVLGFFPGSDPYLKQEIVIIGAHYDYVGDDPSPGLLYSGGNDNASGIAGLLEIARVWQQTGYRPKRSVLFAAWGAQELNQAGSSYYVANPIYPLEDTVAVIQMDGIAGGDGFHPGIQGEWQRDGQLLLRTRTDETLISTAQITPSDHFSFHEYPIPTLLVTWRLANEDNLPDEVSNRVSPERLEICGELVILVLMGVAR